LEPAEEKPVGQRVIVIGASLSGVDALCELIGALPADFAAPIFIVQHVASDSPGLLPQILTKAGKLGATHPTSPEVIENGRVYVAPPDRHMLIEKGYVRLFHGPHENLARPAIDPLFRSAALAYGPGVVGVVLTGQFDDGTAGLLAIKDRGGTTIVQEPSEATTRSMPLSALQHVGIDHRCKIAEMAVLLAELANDDPADPEPETAAALMETENRIAEGIFSVADWWHLERISTPAGLNCPTCRSALYELNDRRVLRFRCRSGHAFSALSLLCGKVDARENLMSSISGVLMEEITLSRRLLDHPEYASNPQVAGGLAARVKQICDSLHTLIGLAEPGPGVTVRTALYTCFSRLRKNAVAIATSSFETLCSSG
jgi:two-component system, chemotaxis family, protein-glutamate methylesterase/glutaminase